MLPSSPPAGDPSGKVKTRRVHYISGFDPRGARYYHRLYEEEAPKQSLVNGGVLQVGKRRKVGPRVNAWSVRAEWKDGAIVETDYQFLLWDEIVRKHWDGSLPKLLLNSIPAYVVCVAVGGFHRIKSVSSGAYQTVIFPLKFLITLFLVMIAAAVGTAWLGSLVFGFGLISVALTLGITFWVGLTGLRRAEKRDVFWILRTCVFIVRWGTRPIPELDERIAEMADHIVREQELHPVDEVLIVGHSVGSIVSVAVTARILEKAGAGPVSPALNLLTLGQCIPYLSFIPAAKAFRHDLEIIGNDNRIPWTDATSPPDPLCFYQVDPIRVSGLTSRFEDRPKRIAVRVFKMFTTESYAKIRKNKLRLHFQYLMASELPSAYDYFSITAGPGKLHARDGVATGPS